MNYFINLNRLQTFVSIVEAGNITKAASVLNVPKSKLSRDLTLLESELGVQLIFRTTRQFQLTQIGLNLYQECKKNLDQIHHLFSDIAFKKQKLSGLIRVTAPEDIGTSLIIEKISQFSSVYPQIKFDLLLTNHLLDLVSNRIDLAIRVGRLKDSTMISKHLGFIDLVLVSSTKYLNTINKLPRIEEFYQLRIVNFLSSTKKMYGLCHLTQK